MSDKKQREKDVTVANKKEEKRKVVRRSSIDNVLAAMKKTKKTLDLLRWLGFDPNGFFKKQISFFMCMKETSWVMCKMLFLSTVQSFALYFAMKLVKYPSIGLEEQFDSLRNATMMDNMMNATEFEGSPEYAEFEEAKYNMMNRATVLGICMTCNIASWLVYVSGSLFSFVSHSGAFIVALPFPKYNLVVYLLFVMEAITSLNPLLFAALTILVCAIAQGLMGYFMVNRPELAGSKASRLAATRLKTSATENAEERPDKSAMEVFKLGLMMGAPAFFIYGVILGYVLLIFNAFSWYDNVAWQVFWRKQSRLLVIREC